MEKSMLYILRCQLATSLSQKCGLFLCINISQIPSQPQWMITSVLAYLHAEPTDRVIGSMPYLFLPSAYT